MKDILHRILFITLIIPIGFLLVIEWPIHLFIESIKWIITGRFSGEILHNFFGWKIYEFLKFDKY